MPNEGATTLLFILHSGNFYGTERMALATLRGLTGYRRRGLLCPPSSGSTGVAQAARAAGFEVSEFRSRFQLVLLLLRWFLGNRSLDIVGNGVNQAVLCAFLARVLGVRLRQLHVVHGGDDEASAYARRDRLNNLAVGIVAVSEFVKERLIFHGVKGNRIAVIENFVEPAVATRPGRVENTDREVAAAADKRCGVIVISRLEAIKRIDLLLEAIESDPLLEFQFDIYGSGIEADAMKARAAPFKNIAFHGFDANVTDKLGNAGYLLHLCPVEPFGLAVLEAFNFGVPVIVPDTGGTAELVEHGRNGLRFRANDPLDLVRVLRTALQLPADARRRMVDEGRRAAATRFAPHHAIESYRQALSNAQR